MNECHWAAVVSRLLYSSLLTHYHIVIAYLDTTELVSKLSHLCLWQVKMSAVIKRPVIFTMQCIVQDLTVILGLAETGIILCRGFYFILFVIFKSELRIALIFLYAGFTVAYDSIKRVT